jgi:hypothetical protein
MVTTLSLYGTCRETGRLVIKTRDGARVRHSAVTGSGMRRFG